MIIYFLMMIYFFMIFFHDADRNIITFLIDDMGFNTKGFHNINLNINHNIK